MQTWIPRLQPRGMTRGSTDLRMKVRDVMRQKVVCLPQNGKLRDIVNTFVKHHIDCLPVVDAAERVVGLITVDDLTDVFFPRYYELLRDMTVLQDKGQIGSLLDTAFTGLDRVQEHLILAADVMNSHLQWISQDDSLLQAASTLRAQSLQRLPVVDRDQKLVGLLSDFEVVLALLQGSSAQVTAS
jgi:CBS domain-containing membrane protein